MFWMRFTAPRYAVWNGRAECEPVGLPFIASGTFLSGSGASETRYLRSETVSTITSAHRDRPVREIRFSISIIRMQAGVMGIEFLSTGNHGLRRVKPGAQSRGRYNRNISAAHVQQQIYKRQRVLSGRRRRLGYSPYARMSTHSIPSSGAPLLSTRSYSASTRIPVSICSSGMVPHSCTA